jgi:proteasome assembly chaperone (PAC2) family protein
MPEKNTFEKKISLKKPCLIAAWPGMGNVAITAVNYLKDQLGAQPLMDFTSGSFFAPTNATVAKQLILPPKTPKNRFYYYKSSQLKNDLLIFIGNLQPITHREYDYSVEILRIAHSLGVQRVYTTAAAPTDMHFKDEPRVFAVPNHRDTLKELMEYHVHFMSEGTIAGMNGLLVSVAAEKQMQGVCLLGEIPFFTAQIEYPKASLAILEVLKKILKIKLDLVDLELYVNQKEKEIAPLANLLTKENPETETPERETGIPSQGSQIPKSVRLKIEKMFRQAEFDKTYKSKMQLKEELDSWGLFNEYLDRFLDLFKKGKEGS